MILDLEPLLDRLEALERRVELLPASCLDELVDRKVAERLEPLERTLAAHDAALTALRVHVEQTDLNLQRLIVAIERLLDRQPPSLPAAANGSFEDHLQEALSAPPPPWPRLPGE